jgi:hypothetical protein
MSASFVRFFAFLIVTGALLACASAPCGPARYAEYSLDASEHPESIDCFYACLRKKQEASRDRCFARCEGVVVATTRSPCEEEEQMLCRGVAIEEAEVCDSEAEEEQASEAIEFLGFVIESGAELATDDSDDDDRKSSRSESPNRRRASPSPKSGSTSKSWTKASPEETLPSSSFGSKLKKR